eukprot:Hpha_TRINITY_DN9407_c0_g1::TRINITY_DN9407_c0_g1_i1::g.139126::m.139126
MTVLLCLLHVMTSAVAAVPLRSPMIRLCLHLCPPAVAIAVAAETATAAAAVPQRSPMIRLCLHLCPPAVAIAVAAETAIAAAVPLGCPMIPRTGVLVAGALAAGAGQETADGREPAGASKKAATPLRWGGADRRLPAPGRAQQAPTSFPTSR